MADYKIRMRAKLKGKLAVVKALINHPMETGRRKDKDGKIIPAHFIQHVTARYKDDVVFDAYWGTGISKNPFVSFSFAGPQKGEQVLLSWTDNLGNSGQHKASIK